MPRYSVLIEDQTASYSNEVGSFCISWDKTPVVQVVYYGQGAALAIDKEELITLLETALEELKK